MTAAVEMVDHELRVTHYYNLGFRGVGGWGLTVENRMKTEDKCRELGNVVGIGSLGWGRNPSSPLHLDTELGVTYHKPSPSSRVRTTVAHTPAIEQEEV